MTEDSSDRNSQIENDHPAGFVCSLNESPDLATFMTPPFPRRVTPVKILFQSRSFSQTKSSDGTLITYEFM
jgi:hypothetical protein